MVIIDLYKYEYDTLSETLITQFSIEGDSPITYRALRMTYDDIISSLSIPSIIEEEDLENLLEDEDFVIDTVSNFLDLNEDKLPEEEVL